MFTAELFTIAKIWKQPVCPLMDIWISNLSNIYFKLQGDLNLAICDNITGTWGHYGKFEISQTKTRSLLYVESKMKHNPSLKKTK